MGNHDIAPCGPPVDAISRRCVAEARGPAAGGAAGRGSAHAERGFRPTLSVRAGRERRKCRELAPAATERNEKMSCELGVSVISAPARLK